MTRSSTAFRCWHAGCSPHGMSKTIGFLLGVLAINGCSDDTLPTGNEGGSPALGGAGGSGGDPAAGGEGGQGGEGPTMVCANEEGTAFVGEKGSCGGVLINPACTCNVERALAAGIPVDSRDESGGTPLLHACYYGDAELARRLLESGADASAASGAGLAPLHRLCASAEKRSWAAVARFSWVANTGAELVCCDRQAGQESFPDAVR
jgi:Ankyrin repeats (many copies)